MLSAIIQVWRKTCGLFISGYLNLWGLIDQNGKISGINTGGWGLHLTTEDIAKFGVFYIQEGNGMEINYCPQLD